MIERRRQPRGVPRGGQFSENTRDEASSILPDELGRRLIEDDSIPDGGVSPRWMGRALHLGIPVNVAARAVEKHAGIGDPHPENPRRTVEVVQWEDLDENERRADIMDVPWMLRADQDGVLRYAVRERGGYAAPSGENPHRRRGSRSMGVTVRNGRATVYLTDEDARRVTNPEGAVMWSGDEVFIPVERMVRLTPRSPEGERNVLGTR